MKFEFICVSGYGKSGSGACVDLLKEFKYIGGIENEFRLAKDPHGLIDLENNLVLNWEFIRHDAAINDFLSYCEMLSRKEYFFGKTGKDFNRKLGIDFVEHSREYIEKLTNFKYYGTTLVHRYNLSKFQSFVIRMRNKFGVSNRKLMYFSKPESDLFLLETKRYIKSLFDSYALAHNLKKVVLNQAIPVGNIGKSIKYFDSSKLILIDRDPRDIFATMIYEKRLLGADNKDLLVDKYIDWHRAIRGNVYRDSAEIDILELKFESFFNDYDSTIYKVKKFLEIDYPHTNKGTKFDPRSISDHVGIWRKAKDQNSMDKIYKEFPSSCY